MSKFIVWVGGVADYEGNDRNQAKAVYKEWIAQDYNDVQRRAKAIPNGITHAREPQVTRPWARCAAVELESVCIRVQQNAARLTPNHATPVCKMREMTRANFADT